MSTDKNDNNAKIENNKNTYKNDKRENKTDSDKKRLFKEIGVWTGLIILTFIGTNIYSMFKPENILIKAFNKTYNQTIIARDSVIVKDDNSQIEIDLARKELAKFKVKVGNRVEYNNNISTWSQILDKAQNDNIVNIKKEMLAAKKAVEEKTENADALVEEAKKDIDTLINSEIKFAQDFGKQLLDELNKK